MKKNLLRLCFVLYIVYMFCFAETFRFMSLNVLLAWIPLELGMLFLSMKPPKWLHYTAGAGWLLFFPNIPYLLTDFFHLRLLDIYAVNGVFSPAAEEWASFFLLTAPIVLLVYVGMTQACQIIEAAAAEWHLLGRRWQLAGEGIVSFLSALAIYVGRFDRLHSVHLITKPLVTLQQILVVWTSDKWFFVIMFAGLQLLMMEVFQRNRVQP